MNEAVKTYLEKYPAEIRDLFNEARTIVFASAPTTPDERMWANLPSYYVGDAFVRLIAFNDHLNIEAAAAAAHKAELAGYKMTPKGMLQIYIGQPIPADLLKQIVAETLG